VNFAGKCNFFLRVLTNFINYNLGFLKKTGLCVFVIILLCAELKAITPKYQTKNYTFDEAYTANKPIPKLKILAQNRLNGENPRLVAAILCIALGPFGTHRLYLGTDYKVPVYYTLTLGGGLGILPLIDLIAIITVEDLNSYRNNPKFIMWIE
jgi:hypothetical protein